MAAAYGLLRLTGLLMAVNAALHFFSFFTVGFDQYTIQFTVVGILYALIAWGLLYGHKMLACITFAIALIGANAAYVGMSFSSIPDWWLFLIVLTDLAVAGVLFTHLWRL